MDPFQEIMDPPLVHTKFQIIWNDPRFWQLFLCEYFAINISYHILQNWNQQQLKFWLIYDYKFQKTSV